MRIKVIELVLLLVSFAENIRTYAIKYLELEVFKIETRLQNLPISHIYSKS
jgi:hypothetical protein